jgi:D-lyxose ketol-isomerase
MQRSVINSAYRAALACFQRHSWHLPPAPNWDITDFGLGDFWQHGLVLVNLATEPEYCEKLMYAREGQVTPCHVHVRKKEDIICRVGEIELCVWPHRPDPDAPTDQIFSVSVNGHPQSLEAGGPLVLAAGSRVTLPPGLWHEFQPLTEECIIGEVSTSNDDWLDNRFIDPRVKRFMTIEEDEPAQVRLVSEGVGG